MSGLSSGLNEMDIKRRRCDLAYSVVVHVPASTQLDDLESLCTLVIIGGSVGVESRFLGRRVDDPAFDCQSWMLVVAFERAVAEDKVQGMFWDIVGGDGWFDEFNRSAWSGAADGETAKRFVTVQLSGAERWVERHRDVLCGEGDVELEFGDSTDEVYAVLDCRWISRKAAREAVRAVRAVRV